MTTVTPAASTAERRTIVRAEATPIKIPLDRPVSFSTRHVVAREYVIATVEAEDGTIGVGYTYAGNSGAREIADVIRNLLAPRLISRGTHDVTSWSRELAQEYLLLGRRGLVTRSLSALDIAGWDLIAKLAGVPLRELLGSSRKSLPAYGSGGYYRPGDPLKEVREEVALYRSIGLDDYKMKFGRLPLAEDMRRVEAARESMAPGGRLALDINNGWSYYPDAYRAVRALEPFDIWWIEEPFLPDDGAGHAKLSRSTPIPIATGEMEGNELAFGSLLKTDAVSILQPDATVMGGVSAWLTVARAAQALGAPVAPHWHANLHAQLGAAATNTLTIEYFALASGVYNFEQVVTNPLQVADNEVHLDQTPGLGVVLDAAAVDRYRIA